MTQEIKITVPVGYEIDRENSTFECVKFKKIAEPLDYAGVCDALMKEKNTFFYSCSDKVLTDDRKDYLSYFKVASPKVNNVLRCLALNKLLNVAEYFNSQHPIEEDSVKFYLYYNGNAKDIAVTQTTAVCNRGQVLFNYAADALSAIKILGENVVLNALGVF